MFLLINEYSAEVLRGGDHGPSRYPIDLLEMEGFGPGDSMSPSPIIFTVLLMGGVNGGGVSFCLYVLIGPPNNTHPCCGI